MYHLQARNTGAPAFPEDLLPQMPHRIRTGAGEEEAQEGKTGMEKGQQDPKRTTERGTI